MGRHVKGSLATGPDCVIQTFSNLDIIVGNTEGLTLVPPSRHELYLDCLVRALSFSLDGGVRSDIKSDHDSNSVLDYDSFEMSNYAKFNHGKSLPSVTVKRPITRIRKKCPTEKMSHRQHEAQEELQHHRTPEETD
ncbi:hypothetical protein ABZP36_009808 [Zizania latifolia]